MRTLHKTKSQKPRAHRCAYRTLPIRDLASRTPHYPLFPDTHRETRQHSALRGTPHRTGAPPSAHGTGGMAAQLRCIGAHGMRALEPTAHRHAKTPKTKTGKRACKEALTSRLRRVWLSPQDFILRSPSIPQESHAAPSSHHDTSNMQNHCGAAKLLNALAAVSGRPSGHL